MAAQKKAELPPEEEVKEKTEQEPETQALEMAELRRKNEELAEQVKDLREEMEKRSVPTVVQVSADAERVHFLWQAEVANENIKTFGDGGMFGRIVGKTGSFYVPKSDLARVMDAENRLFLDKRWLIVVSGLDEEEREALGVNYHDGELLDRRAFEKMVELGDELLELYPELCEGHKVMVAQRYREAFDRGSPYVTRERVTALRDMAQAAHITPNPFTSILQEMNKREAGEGEG